MAKWMSAVVMAGVALCMGGCRRGGTLNERYIYDDRGRLVQFADAAGGRSDWKYNERGLPVEWKTPDETVRFEYDASGKRVAMEDRSGRSEYSYDAFDRLVEVRYGGIFGRRVCYEYDSWGRVKSVSVYGQNGLEYRIHYRFDVAGSLTRVGDGSGDILYAYDYEKNEIMRRLPNGISSVFTFSTGNELQSIRHSDGQGRLIARYLYGHDPAGKIMRVEEETPDARRTIRYEWDTRGYLQALHPGDGRSIRFSYDAMGNRILVDDDILPKDYIYEPLGRLIKAGNTTYESDACGNMVQQRDDRGRSRFAFNARGMPLRLKSPQQALDFYWNGDGELIFMRRGREETFFLPDPLKPAGHTLAEYDSQGRMTAGYIYGDVLLGQRDDRGQRSYFLEDGFDSIRFAVDAFGRITSSRQYSPFAEPLVLSGQLAGNFRCAGEKYLPEVDKYLIGNRLYDPRIGRYMSPDPEPGYLERFDSLNRYTHGSPDPDDFMEPRLNQTTKIRILGVNQYGPKKPTTPEGLLELQTSSMRYSNPNFSSGFWGDMQKLSIQSFDLYRAVQNYCGSVVPPLANIGTNNEVWNEIKSNSSSLEELEGFSNGGITLYNLRAEIVQGIKDGAFPNLREISLPGTGLSQAMRNYLENAGIHNVKVVDRIWDPSVWKDPVKILTTPFADYSAKVPLVWKMNIGGPVVYKAYEAFSSFFQGGLKYHRVPPDSSYHSIPEIRSGNQKEEVKTLSEGNQGYTPVSTDDEKKMYRGPDWPDGGGGGGMLPGRFQGVGSFRDPFNRIESQLGGIKLDSVAEPLAGIGDISGAVYDPEKKCLILLGEEKLGLTGLKPEDLAVALVSVFSEGAQDPQFTLDPFDPKNPEGEWLRPVYIPEKTLCGTEFGNALFSADWLLKQFAFGVRVDEQGHMTDRKMDVPGMKSQRDLLFERTAITDAKPVWARMWIVSEEMKLKRTANSVYFETARLGVRAKKIVPDPENPQGFRDVDTEDNPTASDFARLFSEHYDEIAHREPAFERVRQLAKAVAIAKWIKQEGIPFDSAWVNEYASRRVKYASRVPSVTVNDEKRTKNTEMRGNQQYIVTRIHQVKLFGGVDLKVNPVFVAADQGLTRLRENMAARLKEKVVTPVFVADYPEKPVTAVVLPLTSQGQEIWKKTSTAVVDNVRYFFNVNKEIIRSIGTGGSENTYSYDSDHRLKTVQIRTREGWRISGERIGEGTSWNATTPRGIRLTWRYGQAGYLQDLSADGRKVAAFNYAPERNEIEVVHGQGDIEKITSNSSGQVTNYELTRTEGAGAEKESVNVEYDAAGRLIRIAGSGVVPVSFIYDGESRLPQSFRGGPSELRYEYDGESRLTGVFAADGRRITMAYEGDAIKRVVFSSGERSEEYRFEQGRLANIRHWNGVTTAYTYTQEGLLSSVVDANGQAAGYAYDSLQRIKEIRLPDGRRIEYHYERATPEEARKTGGSLVKTVSIHAGRKR